MQTTENKSVPQSYNQLQDTASATTLHWTKFFADPNLQNLIDTALRRNQELNITWKEIELARNEIRFKDAALFPTVGAGVGVGLEKVGRYTSQGAGDASTEIKPGKEMPDPLSDLRGAVYASWEIDIWQKLHNAKKAALTRYLSTVEGKNFVITNLIAEVARSYYELLALDTQLEIVQQTIALQNSALEIVKIPKESARVTELAVPKFHAKVFHSQCLEFDIRPRIKEPKTS